MKKVRPVGTPAGRSSEFFDELTFDRNKMQKALEAKTFYALLTASIAKTFDALMKLELSSGVEVEIKVWGYKNLTFLLFPILAF